MSDSLSRLVEAVRSAGVDIAPDIVNTCAWRLPSPTIAARQDEKGSSPCVPYR